MDFLNRIKDGLKKTRKNLLGRMDDLFARKTFDEEFFEQLEEILISTDIGIETTMELVDKLRNRITQDRIKEPEQVICLLKGFLLDILGENYIGLNIMSNKPTVVLVLGVNGVGKTTTIGKLAYNLSAQGKKVLLAAGDTFRAAAIEQLEIWAGRSGAEIIRHQQGSDPAAVLFDAVNAAQSRNFDIVLCDTAGRLHNKVNLMEELKKVSRVVEKALPGAPHEILLVLDATTGQNALVQARSFNETAPITGLVLTKLDGSARGGIVIAVAKELGIPVKYIGVGEGLEDLQPFNASEYVEGLFALQECSGK